VLSGKVHVLVFYTPNPQLYVSVQLAWTYPIWYRFHTAT